MLWTKLIFRQLLIFSCITAVAVHGYHVGVPSGNMTALASSNYVRGCYYTNWAQYRQEGKGKFMPEDIPKGLCTHILYAFAKIEDDGTSVPFEWNDEDTDWSEGMFSRVMKNKETNPGLKILLSYGGYNFGSPVFTGVAQSAEKRKHFIESAIAFLRKNRFDGFDLDWEYPLGVAKDHATLVKEMKAAFVEEAKSSGKEQLLLTAAVAAGKDKIDDGYDVPSLANDFDLLFLMSYDLHGPWDPNVDLHGKLHSTKGETVGAGIYNTEFAAKYWAEKGMPKEKIIIGIPTYGQGWTLKDQSQTEIGAAASGKAAPSTTNPDGGTASYWEICNYLKDGGKETVDKDGVGAYMVKGNQWYGYDNPETVKMKMEWLKKEGFGGAFIWCLDFDDFKGTSCGKGPYPLMSAISEGLGGGGETAPDVTTTTEGGEGTTTAASETTKGPEEETKSTAGEETTTEGEAVTTTEGEAVTTTAESTTTTKGGIPTEKPSDEECTDPNGTFPDPKDCHQFIQCSNGHAKVMACAPGTFYNEQAKICDHMENAPSTCK